MLIVCIQNIHIHNMTTSILEKAVKLFQFHIWGLKRVHVIYKLSFMSRASFKRSHVLLVSADGIFRFCFLKLRVSLLDKKAITCNNYCNIINMHDNIPYEKNKTNIVATCICNHTHPESGSALRKPNTRLIKLWNRKSIHYRRICWTDILTKCTSIMKIRFTIHLISLFTSDEFKTNINFHKLL